MFRKIGRYLRYVVRSRTVMRRRLATQLARIRGLRWLARIIKPRVGRHRYNDHEAKYAIATDQSLIVQSASRPRRRRLLRVLHRTPAIADDPVSWTGRVSQQVVQDIALVAWVEKMLTHAQYYEDVMRNRIPTQC